MSWRAHELCVSVDDRQEVIEVVGDTTCEAPDGLELLRSLIASLEFEQLLLLAAALRHILDDTDDFEWFAAFVTQQPGDRADRSSR
jgi:hypothetical protein